MKKLIENIGIETAFAGLFGFIAIVAVFFEMAIAGFEAASIAGGVKDIAGTIVTVVMLIVAIKALAPKKKTAGGFIESFEEEMKKVEDKYDRLIQKADIKQDDTAQDDTQQDDSKKNNAKKVIDKQERYNIADSVDVLYKFNNVHYHRLFDLKYYKDHTVELLFSVSKTLFMGQSSDDFVEQTSIIESIASKITREYNDILDENYKTIQGGFKLTFKKELLTPEDAVDVVKIIDKVILYYTAACKK